MRAAASSIPRGRPSRSVQISATTGSSCPGVQSGATDRARSAKRRTAASVVDASSDPGPSPTVSGRDGIFLLAGDPKRRAARDDEARPWRGADESCDLAGRGEKVLEVVEHDETRPLREELGKCVGGGSLGAVEQSESPGDRGAHVVWVGHGLERDEPSAVGDRLGAPARELDREARLADPARPGQRHQPVLVEQRVEPFEIRGSADERRHPLGDVSAGRPRDAKGREVRPQARDVDLVQRLGRRDVPQDEAPERSQAAAGGQACPTSGSVVPDTISCPPWPTAAIRATRLTSKPP